MKKTILRTGAALLVLLAIAGIWVFQSGPMRMARAMPVALTAATSDDRVEITDGKWLVFRPRATPVRMGVIFYPGARCDVRGYAPVLRRIAEAGYLVVDVRMPLNFAVLAPNRGREVPPAFSDVQRWVIIGHSLGGAMAGYFVHNNPGAVAGVIIWDSYPPEADTLANAGVPVWHIHRATRDGTPPLTFQNKRNLFPADSRWVPIRGGIHMYFGSFEGGGYREEWTPLISRETQQDEVVAATLEGLAAMAPVAAAR